MSKQAPKRIPYGISDFRRMQTDNAYYVDKTHFIPTIEAAPYYLFFIRPRRFGKSLWMSVLQHYYDVNTKDDFETLFGDTYIGQNPTAERNSYLVLSLNFAMVNPDQAYLHDSFETHGKILISGFLERYSRFFSEQEQQAVQAHSQMADQLQQILFYAGEKGLKVYLFIDEYDNFANTILSIQGQQAYHDLTHGDGFFRYFFNLLKGTTGGQFTGLARLFITGVSLITMDDVTSGFNIGDNVSTAPQFNEMVGFTDDEARAMVTHYHDAGALSLDVEAAMATMRRWYNNYRFAPNAQSQLFNSDMVLHFIKEAIREDAIPRHLIDQNIRIDYQKLRHLITVDKQLNGNFSQLRTIIETNEVVSQVSPGFPLKQLTARENFISLLYYFGLLTFAGEREGEPLLQIPNLTVKDLMYSYIRDGFDDVDVFRVDPWQLSTFVRGMAYRGEWQPFFEFLAAKIQEQTSIRDYLNGEKVIQGFLLAYLNVSHFFHIWSEKEMGGGFVDLYMEPFLARYPDMTYGYLIELKYIPRGEFSKKRLQTEITNAATQLRRYASDVRIQKVANQTTLKKLALVYNGWELVHLSEINTDSPA